MMKSKYLYIVFAAAVLAGCGSEDQDVADSEAAINQSSRPLESFIVANVETLDSIGSSCSEVLDFAVSSSSEFSVMRFSLSEEGQWVGDGFPTPSCFETMGEELCNKLGGKGPQLVQIAKDPLILKQDHAFDCKVEYVIEGDWSDLKVTTRYPSGCGSSTGQDIISNAIACTN